MSVQGARHDIARHAAKHRRGQHARARLAALVEASDDAIIGLRLDGAIDTWNAAAAAIFGYAAEEVIGRPIGLLLSPDRPEGIARLLGLLGRGERVHRQETLGVHKEGGRLPVTVSCSPARAGGGQVIGGMVVVRDHSARARARQSEERAQATAESNRELRRSNTELEQFASVAAHDLQEPLRKILAFGDRLKQADGGTLSPEGQDYLERMHRAAARMQALIDDLLAYARIAISAQPFVRVDLAAVARDVLTDLELQLERTGGRVLLGDLPALDGDPHQLRQVLQNMIGNALKFRAPDRAPVVTIESTLEPMPAVDGRQETGCRLVIRDNGIGFDQKYAERIFGMFQRLHGRDAYAGTGIGLAICRRIVERHGGQITATSTPGQGATFHIVLPIDPPRGVVQQ